MRALVDLLVPPSCDGCGCASPPPWCDDCHDRLVAARPTTPCRLCADADVPGHACWRVAAPVTSLVTLGPWHGGVARAVTRAKLVGRGEVLRGAGRLLGDAVRDADVAVDVVVGVPSDRRRVRQRGRDHTRDLATGAARALGVGVVAPFARVVGAPDRVAAGGRAAPGTVVTAGPEVRVAAAVVGRRVLLVDDVVTTGATLASTAAALSSAGVREVVGAAVGRALGHVLSDPAERSTGRP